MNKSAFLTGSRVYGAPGIDSDYDLVMPTDDDVRDALVMASDNGGYPIRFGKLNLILVSDAEFAIWRKMTDEMILRSKNEQRPITREEATYHRETVLGGKKHYAPIEIDL